MARRAYRTRIEPTMTNNLTQKLFRLFSPPLVVRGRARVGAFTVGSALRTIFLLLFSPIPLFAADLRLWYTQPAKTWMTDALPIGNGRLGAMIVGDPHREQIQFNE